MPFIDHKRETLLNGKSLAEYYVIFCESEIAIPFIDKSLSHCYAARWDGYNWLVINPVLGFTDIYILPCVEPNVRAAFANIQYVDIIHVSAWRTIKKWRSPWPQAFTCVEQVKALLGISNFWIHTPKQLYKHLGGSHGFTAKQTKNAD